MEGFAKESTKLILFCFLCFSCSPTETPHTLDPTLTLTITTPTSGFKAGNKVVIQASRPSQIFYTLDNSEPTKESFPYTEPLELWSTTTLKAIAIDTKKLLKSRVAEKTFVIDSLFPEVWATPTKQQHPTPIFVRLHADEKATIYYTTDGSEPTKNSNTFKNAIKVEEDTWFQFFAVDEAGHSSAIQHATYYFAPILTLSPSSNLFRKKTSVEVKVTTNKPATTQVRFPHLSTDAWLPYNQPFLLEDDAVVDAQSFTKLGGKSEIKTSDIAFFPQASQEKNTLATFDIDTLLIFDPYAEGKSVFLFSSGKQLFCSNHLENIATTKSTLTLEQPAIQIFAWDIDGNGSKEVLILDSASTLSIYQFKEGCILQKNNGYKTLTENQQYSFLTMTDANADGSIDLIALTKEKKITFFHKTTAGFQQKPTPFVLTEPVKSVLVGDWNHDNKDDYLILFDNKKPPVLFSQQKPFVFGGIGLGNFLRDQSTLWTDAARSDINADGKEDIVLLGYNEKSGEKIWYLAILIQVGLNHWKPMIHEDISTSTEPMELQVIDIDLDGFEDILLFQKNQQLLVKKNFLGRKLWDVKESLEGMGVAFWYQQKMLIIPTQHSSPYQLFYPSHGNYMQSILRGSRENRSGIGTVLSWKKPPFTFHHRVGFRNLGPFQTPLFQPLGLGRKNHPKLLAITWPDGLSKEVFVEKGKTKFITKAD